MVWRILQATALLVLGSRLLFAAGLPATTDDVVILAQTGLTLGLRSELASGQVVVNDPAGVVVVRPLAQALADTAIIGNTIAIERTVRAKPVLFDLFANSLTGQANAIISGTVSPLPGLPLFVFPTVPTVTPGTSACPNRTGTRGNCVVRLQDGPVTLAPGSYGTITVREHGLLYLSGGEYNIKALRLVGTATALANGSTTINVQKDASFGVYSVFGPADSKGLSGRCVIVNVAGKHVRFLQATVEATIIAANGNVNVGSQTAFTGNLVAQNVRVGPAVLLRAAAPVSGCP